LRVFSIGARNRAINPFRLSFYRVAFPASIGTGEVGFGFGGDMMRHAGVALVSSFIVAIAVRQPSIAEAQQATGDCFVWIDAATGKRLPTTPVGTELIAQGGQGSAHLTGQAHLTSGQNAFRDANGNWIDSATGSYLPTTPVGTELIAQGGQGSAHLTGQAHLTNGVNAVRVPCPPPTENATGTPVMPPAVGTGEPHKTGTGSRDGNPADDKKTATTSAKPDTSAKTDTPSTAPAGSKTIEKQDAAVDRRVVTPDQPKSTTDKPGGEKATPAKTAKTSRTASKKTKKEEDKVQVHIEFYSTKSGGGGGGFNGGGYGR